VKIPDFKPATEFFGEISLPCLVAKVRNSTLPKVATRHIYTYKSDERCGIYLRCAKAGEISGWQQKMLEYLFEKEALPAVLAEGMKEYETSKKWPGYDQLENDNYHDIKRYGIIPHLSVSAIVIDGVTREVIIAAHTDWDGHLNEHGITIYLSKGRWRFDLGDRQYSYSSKIRLAVMEERIAAVCPAIEAGGRNDMDVTFLFGAWKFDKKEALSFYQKIKWRRSEVDNTLPIYKGLRLIFSPTRFQRILQSVHDDRVRYKRCGNKVVIYSKNPKRKDDSPLEYYYTGNLLVNLYGEVLSHESESQRFVKQPKY
jgi:hypothetical protein